MSVSLTDSLNHTYIFKSRKDVSYSLEFVYGFSGAGLTLHYPLGRPSCGTNWHILLKQLISNGVMILTDQYCNTFQVIMTDESTLDQDNLNGVFKVIDHDTRGQYDIPF